MMISKNPKHIYYVPRTVSASCDEAGHSYVGLLQFSHTQICTHTQVSPARQSFGGGKTTGHGRTSSLIFDWLYPIHHRTLNFKHPSWASIGGFLGSDGSEGGLSIYSPGPTKYVSVETMTVWISGKNNAIFTFWHNKSSYIATQPAVCSSDQLYVCM